MDPLTEALEASATTPNPFDNDALTRITSLLADQILSSPAPEPLVDDIIADAEQLIAHRQAQHALKYFRLAAILGHSGARATTAALLLSGDNNISRDIATAVRHLRAAASRGQPDAHAMLGMLHASGIADRHGVRKSLPAAILHWTFAAATGNIYASTALAFRHMHGLGVPKNCRTAAQYYRRAADAIARDPRHWPTAANFLDGKPPLPSGLTNAGRLRYDDKMLQKKREVSSDDSDLIQFYRHSAERGDMGAMTTLGGLHYYGGYGIEPNEQRAREVLQRAANAEHGEAHGMLGHLAMRERKNETAIIHFRYSAAKNDKIGHYALGMIFLHGILGMNQDYSKAAMHFTLATEDKKQHAGASFQLGLLYWKGRGVEKNYSRAFSLFMRAAKLGNIQAKLNVGTILLEGAAPVGQPDCQGAVKYLKQVAEDGEWKTLFMLASNAFDNGDKYGALYRQLQAAYAGIEVAQYNAAILLEKTEDGSMGELMHWNRERRLSEAHELYGYSGAQGHTASLIRSANIMYMETGEYEEAARVFAKAAEMKSGEGLVSLGLMHAHGLGVKEDRQQAIWYLTSASSADPEAVAPATIAIIGLRIYWLLKDLWDRISLFIEEDVHSSSGDAGDGRIQEEQGKSGDADSGEEKVIRIEKKAEFSDDIALLGALLVAVLTVLVVRTKRLARQPANTEDRGR